MLPECIAHQCCGWQVVEKDWFDLVPFAIRLLHQSIYTNLQYYSRGAHTCHIPNPAGMSMLQACNVLAQRLQCCNAHTHCRSSKPVMKCFQSRALLEVVKTSLLLLISHASTY